MLPVLVGVQVLQAWSIAPNLQAAERATLLRTKLGAPAREQDLMAVDLEGEKAIADLRDVNTQPLYLSASPSASHQGPRH